MNIKLSESTREQLLIQVLAAAFWLGVLYMSHVAHGEDIDDNKVSITKNTATLQSRSELIVDHEYRLDNVEEDTTDHEEAIKVLTTIQTQQATIIQEVNTAVQLIQKDIEHIRELTQ